MKTDWRTPIELFIMLDQDAKGFKVDAAATEENRLCQRWYGPGSPDGEDALKVPLWLSPAFCNPPYDDLEAWTRKFAEQKDLGINIVAIVPANVGTKWWAKWVVSHAQINFCVGRIPFETEGTQKSQNRHDSAVLVYSPDQIAGVQWWDWKPAFDQLKTLREETVDGVNL